MSYEGTQADYVPQVGDRIKTRGWGDAMWMDVTYIGRTVIVGDREDGYERSYMLHGQDCVKATPPVVYPERWITVYPDGVYSRAWPTRAEAARRAHGDRIAVIHLAADGTLTLHPVERES